MMPETLLHSATSLTFTPSKCFKVGESGYRYSCVLAENERFVGTTQEIGGLERAVPSDPEKVCRIQQLKKLGAIVFEGSTDPVDKGLEGWWKSILTRRRDAHSLAWKIFRDIFEEKYYPNMYCEVKRDEFWGLKQGTFSMAEYERKYTKLSWYADVIVAFKHDRCHRFERGLRSEIRTPVTALKSC
ncbi:uncharacterized protein E5676_scaffold419G00440 [Cucumis melo var. makuwa]|uniref:Retrotransposon gag domain-containing protein n=1 Tax=Cucumis melo var. makuwa TaxID=1194695 RepID=A0A5D3DK33_CUCMM|nr:uncharacterized protein E5676_scaffold419G00440 [Cucumis melo var. makuwa]